VEKPAHHVLLLAQFLQMAARETNWLGPWEAARGSFQEAGDLLAHGLEVRPLGPDPGRVNVFDAVGHAVSSDEDGGLIRMTRARLLFGRLVAHASAFVV